MNAALALCENTLGSGTAAGEHLKKFPTMWRHRMFFGSRRPPGPLYKTPKTCWPGAWSLRWIHAARYNYAWVVSLE